MLAGVRQDRARRIPAKDKNKFFDPFDGVFVTMAEVKQDLWTHLLHASGITWAMPEKYLNRCGLNG